ncbi:MAG TPA: hypothetical protein VGO91_06135 [Pyrinomonadaceae bacterium]|nr:hypothetical protein [Pyrinomonadaceae bacterium]
MNRDDEWLGELKETEARLKELYTASRRNGGTWQATGAVFGLAGGIIAASLGMLLSAGAWALGDESNGLTIYGVGNILLLSTIPLLLAGGSCLDLLDKRMVKSGRISSDDAKRAAKSSNRTRARRAATALLLVMLCGTPSETQAQQTVFNVPTTDVLDPGGVYFELDISAKPNHPKFSSFVPRGMMGVGGRIEVGLNLTGNVQPGADTTTLVPAVKWKVYDGQRNGWAIALGDNLFIPVRHRSYHLGTYAYAMMQKAFKSNTRVGFGGYFFSRNVVAPHANRAGGQFTFEQPLTKKLNINADWFTGKHSNGYFTSGGAYRLTDNLTGVAAYSVGNANASKGNHFFYFELGYNFN